MLNFQFSTGRIFNTQCSMLNKKNIQQLTLNVIFQREEFSIFNANA